MWLVAQRATRGNFYEPGVFMRLSDRFAGIFLIDLFSESPYWWDWADHRFYHSGTNTDRSSFFPLKSLQGNEYGFNLILKYPFTGNSPGLSRTYPAKI
jgi:hypothetical protein